MVTFQVGDFSFSATQKFITYSHHTDRCTNVHSVRSTALAITINGVLFDWLHPVVRKCPSWEPRNPFTGTYRTITDAYINRSRWLQFRLVISPRMAIQIGIETFP